MSCEEKNMSDLSHEIPLNALAHPEQALPVAHAVPLCDEQPNPCPACGAPLRFDPDACEVIVESRWVEQPQVTFDCPACGAAVAIFPKGECQTTEEHDEAGEMVGIAIGPPTEGFWIGVVSLADTV
jgi:hypothetical protein